MRSEIRGALGRNSLRHPCEEGGEEASGNTARYPLLPSLPTFITKGLIPPLVSLTEGALMDGYLSVRFYEGKSIRN